jgi:D-alanyl-D-alanine dipeptidase
VNRDFAFVDEAVPGIRWDAKYATWDNFTGRPVDGYPVNRIAGTRALCSALADARDTAAASGLGLLLWDGYRPQRAVDCFVRWSRQPEDGLTKRRHYPNIARLEVFARGYVAARSGHSRGSTVDLTLYRLAGSELAPMGGRHDLMDPISHHGATQITPTAARNRAQLRAIMETCGFTAYASEWWHYTLTDEPFPDTYFDFIVTSRGGEHPPKSATMARSDAASGCDSHRPVSAVRRPEASCADTTSVLPSRFPRIPQFDR